MSISKTKKALTDCLKTSQERIVLLSGEWGTGKTYLWKSLKAEISWFDFSAYFSAQSYSSLDELKTAVLSSLIESVNFDLDRGSLIKLSSMARRVNRVLPEGVRLNFATPIIQQKILSIRSVLPSQVLIVIDDLERAAQFDVGQFLGFMSFLSEEAGFKVLLIMNADGLKDKRKDVFDELREKYIDTEVKMAISSDEACNAASVGLNDSEKTVFRKMADRLSLKNIRVIRQAVLVYLKICSTKNFPPESLLEMIPSVLLFTAIKYVKRADYPDFEFALKASNYSYVKESISSESERRKREFLIASEIRSIGTFEERILVPYLTDGVLDGEIMLAYASELNEQESREKFANTYDLFWERFHWDKEFDASAAKLMRDELSVYVLGARAGEISSVAAALSDMGLSEDGESLVDLWIEGKRDAISMEKIPFERFGLSDNFHHKINSEYEKARKKLYPDYSLLDAIMYLSTHGSWGSRQSDPIVNASVDDFKRLILEADRTQLRAVLYFFGDYLSGRVTGSSFISASKKFAEAASSFIKSGDRIGQIIHRFFRAIGLDDKGEKRVESVNPTV